jgi:hypothetical protein
VLAIYSPRVSRFGPLLIAGVLLALAPSPLSAQTAVAPDIVFAGYLQTQYNRITNENGDARDRAIFRRIIVGVEATLGDRWAGEIQVDLAPPTLANAS